MLESLFNKVASCTISLARIHLWKLVNFDLWKRKIVSRNEKPRNSSRTHRQDESVSCVPIVLRNFQYSHVFGFTVILCEGNEMIQRALVTGPYK